MRAAQLAELTGTTVRTVRHYHHIGLLPVPPTRGGARDYDLGHVARMARIRWLVDAGVPLTGIQDILTAVDDGPPDAGSPDAGSPDAAAEPDARASVLDDLQACVNAIDARLAALTAQRERLARLLDAAADGAPLTPLPAVIAGYYHRIESIAPNPRTRQAIRRERDFIELAWYRGDVPPETELLFRAISDEQAEQNVAQFSHELDAELGQSELEAQADRIVRGIVSRLGDDPVAVAKAVDLDLVHRAYGLFAAVGTPQEYRLGHLVLDRLVAEIERNRR
jgi:DNA-binding transcriptional MerR regulator